MNRTQAPKVAGAGAPWLDGSESLVIALSLRSHLEERPGPAERSLRLAADLLRGGRVRVFHLSHRPEAAGAPGTLELAREILRLGGVPLVSLAMAGLTCDEAIATVAAYREAGIRQLILVTGDYPVPGSTGAGQPRFDLDSLQLLALLAAAKGGVGPRIPHLGCAVSPFKASEAEQVLQYAKLSRKLAAGAGFVVAQAGFDPRRWDELARLVCDAEPAAPLLATVLVPDAGLLRRLAAAQVPGVSITRQLAQAIAREQQGPDGGRHAALNRAAGSLALLRGLRYRGALLAGPGLEAGEVERVLQQADALAPRWRECVEEAAVRRDGFHWFQPSNDGELNGKAEAPLAPRRRRHPHYLLSWAIDYVAFGSLLLPFRVLAAVCRFCDRGRLRRRALWLLEYLAKRPLYGCRMCGDCTLYACGFLCAESGCPKRMYNGPCGGSRDGQCEVHPGTRTCFWVAVYARLKGLGERPDLPLAPIPPKDRRLEGTCSWVNFCLGRDHRREWVRRRLG